MSGEKLNRHGKRLSERIALKRKELETKRTGWDERKGLQPKRGKSLRPKYRVETKGQCWDERRGLTRKRKELKTKRQGWNGSTVLRRKKRVETKRTGYGWWHVKERAETKRRGLRQKGKQIDTLKWKGHRWIKQFHLHTKLYVESSWIVGVVLPVHVRVFNCHGRRVSTWDPAKVFF